jgi:hypothetical protein
LQVHVTASEAPQEPDVAALASQTLQAEQVPVLTETEPANPELHAHDVAFSAEELEGGQAVHWLGRSEAAKVPAAHAWHAAAAVLPTPLWNVPASQAVQAADAVLPVPVW